MKRFLKGWIVGFIGGCVLLFGTIAIAQFGGTGAWDSLVKFLADPHTWTATQTFEEGVVIGTSNVFPGISKTIANPADSDVLYIGQADVAFTPHAVSGICMGGTSVVVQIQECDSAGANCAAIHDALTIDTNGASTTTFTDTSVAANAVLTVDIGAVTGGVTQVQVRFK